MPNRSLAMLSLLGAVLLWGCSDRVPAPVATAQPSPAAAVASPSSPGLTPGAPAAPETAQPGGAKLEGARVMAHITMLANTIGPRVSGTAGEKAAADYISAQFKGSGYTVELMSFTFEGDRFRAGSVTGAGAPLQVSTMTGSPGGVVSGALAYVGIGDAEGIGGRSLTGKIAVADRGTLTFREKYDNLAAAGAAAIIVVNNQPGSLSGTIGQQVDRPMVGTADTAGPALRAAAAGGTQVTLDVPVGTTTTGVNVIARATPGEKCTVLVGGHHDSVPSTGAANDNASGAAHVIELARALAADGLDRGLCFATFGGEESGLFGSKALVTRLKGESALPRVYLNLDVTGIGSSVEVLGDAALQREALGVAQALGIPAVGAALPRNTGSDHQSFSDASVPVVYLSSGDFPTIHSPKDLVADIEPDELQRVGDLGYALIVQLLRDVA